MQLPDVDVYGELRASGETDTTATSCQYWFESLPLLQSTASDKVVEFVAK